MLSSSILLIREFKNREFDELNNELFQIAIIVKSVNSKYCMRYVNLL